MGPSICCQVSQEDHLHLKIKHMVGRVILLGVPVDVPFGWPLPSVSTEWLRVSQGANWTVPPCQVEWKAKKFWLKWTWRRKLQCLQLDFSTFQCLYLDFPSSCLLLLLLLLILFLCILLLIPFVRDSLHHLFLLLCASDFLRSLAVFFARDVSSHFQVRHLAGVLPQHHSLVWRISLRKIHPWASSSVFRSCKCSDKLINSCKHRNWPKTLSESRTDAKCENEVKWTSLPSHRSPDRWWCRLWKLFLSKEHRLPKGLTNWNGILMHFPSSLRHQKLHTSYQLQTSHLFGDESRCPGARESQNLSHSRQKETKDFSNA